MIEHLTGNSAVFYFAIAIVCIVGFIWEIITVGKYCWNDDQKIIEYLFKQDKTQKPSNKPKNKKRKPNNKPQDLESWINDHLEIQRNHPINLNDKYYILKQYPDIFHQSTRSNLRFISTICTSIGVLGTFYGIQSGITDIPLDNLNQTDALMKGVGTLLAGMTTAFSTSLVGLFVGSAFTIFLFFTDFIRQSQHDKLRRKLHKITVPKKDNKEDAVKSLQEIAASFQNFDFQANLRATEALQQVAERLDAETIGIEVGRAVSSQLDRTIETRLTPAFNNIANSQNTLTEITNIQRNVLENLISEMKNQLIIPVVDRLDQSAELTQQASAAVTTLHNELGGISQSLASSIVTIQQFQQQTLGELKNFANSLQSTLHDFQTETTNVLQQTGVSITQAVETSIRGMESQREAFQQSATQAAETFRGIRSELEQSLTTQSEQQEQMLRRVYGELNNFANSLQSTLNNFQTDTTNVLQQTGVSISQAVETSITGMESQREAFQQSATQAAETFSGIRENLEQSLANQSEQQNQMLRRVYAAFSQIINRTNESFTTQTQTLETVGREASELMNSARENLEHTLSNIDESLQNTRITVQEELKNFRDEYQNSLTQFFNEQNQLLESTLGTQRNTLQEVVNDLRNAFQEETNRRQSLMDDLNNTIDGVTRGMNEITTATNNLHEKVQEIQRYTAAMGLHSGERITQLQELSRNIGTATQDFNTLLHNWENHLDQYINTSQNHLNQYMTRSTEWQDRFFDEADSSITRLCSNILTTANQALVSIGNERRSN